MKRYPLNL